MSSYKFLLASLLSSVAFGLPTDQGSQPRSPVYKTSRAPVDVAEFGLGTWVENIAVRPNGKILVTMITPPEIWEVDPFKPPASNATRLVQRFDTAGLVTGITELEPDIFMAVGGAGIWRVDMNKGLTSNASEVVSIAGSGFLNGIATLDAKKGTVLVADSALGLLWRVNTKIRTYELGLQDDTMAPEDLGGMLIGINGVRVWKNYVYYNNTPRQLICRVRIDRATGNAVGPYEIIAQGVRGDDFAVGQDGTVYVAELTRNIVTHVRLNGEQTVIAGNLNSTAVAGATSAAFGRTKSSRNVLYVTTDGASTAPVNGSIVTGGKVVAVVLRSAAAIYSVAETTLRRRRAGRPARRDCQPNSKKLTQLEEEVIVKYILDLDLRRFAPTYAAVRDMANRLLAARGADQVGVYWPRNFVKRTDSLMTRFNRAYDRQRALCEDLVLIRGWFELVEQTKATYGICDEDVYNFNKGGFMMGKITTQLVVTGLERRGRPKTVQPGDREWVTVIAAINAAGWSVPLFLIFAGKYHLSAWYEEAEIPRDWAIAVSDNGWTNNELGVEWLKHFNAHTKARTVGARCLLILNSHESHHSLKFQELCLVPLEPETVLLKLDVQLRTPTPPAALTEAPWEACTPSNVRELEAQSTIIRDRVRKHKSSSPASIIKAINQLKKGAEVMILSAKLIKERIASLEKANEAASKRRERKKKRIQKQGLAREERQGGEQSGLSRQALARYISPINEIPSIRKILLQKGCRQSAVCPVIRLEDNTQHSDKTFKIGTIYEMGSCNHDQDYAG
ncbi:hypothetical protein OPT61_g6105 [Boeremia exigua]|uniref:Uncharacterized protein n=1 Tax=Boeremia exigua TaxID=749465 RepID=A0ACC2I7V8_9PLEO|nr:hypothetical protein OPT61_g6105 [Boeremia exigua]